ncbi:TRAP transporter substrate-binding protein [Ralstonia sp. 24A2]|uniref:TRAP transporter substrate-binding protein n=1 Tax=Ralstonia sp. 24A2 TaxID=3447364 RepID=UPI003F6A3316
MTSQLQSQRRRSSLIGLLLALGLNGTALAQTMQLRIGTVVPRNSIYHQKLMEMGEAWRNVQGGNAKFVVFTDGSQGGETELARRMRIGQLQGALMSVVGLREIDRSIYALQNLPLLFRSWEEVDYVREKMRPGIEKRFMDKGFVILGWGDAGWVRFFSKDPAFAPDDFKPMKFFSWGSEPEQQAIMKSFGYTPVPLETADVLPSIQTGMINVVPSTPYFALASQIYTAAPNMLDINWAPIVGALVVTKNAWDEMTPAAQRTLRTEAEKASIQMRIKARQEVDDAVTAMQKRGLKVNKPSPEQWRQWTDLAENLYPRIRGTMVPADVFDEVFMHLKVYRTWRGQSK